jgi:hypothetical protein
MKKVTTQFVCDSPGCNETITEVVENDEYVMDMETSPKPNCFTVRESKGSLVIRNTHFCCAEHMIGFYSEKS